MPNIDSLNRRLIDYMRAKAPMFHYERFYAPQLGKVNASVGGAYTSNAESAAYTVTDPGDTPADADALRDDLVANTLPDLFTDLNALRTAVENLRVLVEGGLPQPYGTTNKGQGLPCHPLADNDELHALVPLHPHIDQRFPIYVRWWLLPNNADSSSTITTTIDKINMTRNLTGSSALADGATALNTVIPAIVAAETVADTPFASDWGIIKQAAGFTEFDALFIKMVSTSNGGAGRLRVYMLEVAQQLRKFAGRRH